MKTTCDLWVTWNPFLGNGRPPKVCSTGLVILFHSIIAWPAYISVSSPCCITLARPWAFDIVVFVTTVIFCSRCPPPAALLPISPVLISVSTPQLFCLRLNNTLLQHTVLNTAHSQISLLQMESGCFSVLLAGTVPALAASLAVVAVFQLAGALLACCLARYCSLQIQIILLSFSPSPRMVATEKREWYELSDHWQ